MIDWLARRSARGGIVDFRLPTDSQDIPDHVFAARLREYYAQVRAQVKTGQKPPPGQASLI